MIFQIYPEWGKKIMLIQKQMRCVRRILSHYFHSILAETTVVNQAIEVDIFMGGGPQQTFRNCQSFT